MPTKRITLWLAAILIALLTFNVRTSWAAPQTMHIMEGYLPLWWSIFWWIVAAPFWAIGLYKIRTTLKENPQHGLLLGLAGGFIFVLSALKIPSVTGSSSHPTGTGLGTILFGPFVIAVLGTIALIFQAMLVAHGGITTLGANAVSMAIGGPLIAFGVWHLLKDRLQKNYTIFITAFVANLSTYLITTTQLALAFPDPASGLFGSWLTFASIFALTQIPLAIAEGILTVLIFNALQTNAAPELRELGLQEQ